MNATKGSAVPVAVCVASPPVCILCECVCVCLWDTPLALLLVEATKGNSSSCIYCMGRERLPGSERAVGGDAAARKEGSQAPGVCLVHQLSHILNSGGNTSPSLKLHYISEAKNNCNVKFSHASFFITYFHITLYVFLCVL